MKVLIAIVCACSCTAVTPGPTGSDVGSDAGTAPDPFAPQPDDSMGLINVGTDLDAILEHGALATACSDYATAPNDRRLRLLCGKAMFFDESFGTPGIPKPIVTWLIDNFPDDVGSGFARLGMIADPRSSDRLPIGLPPGPKIGTVESVSFGCASCHFGRLPDGRYAVAAPNHDYAYGRMTLMLTMLPALALPGADPSQHDPDALAAIQSLRDRMTATPAIGTALLVALLPLLGGGGATLPSFAKDNEHWYAQWRTGTMDFFIQPLPFDDGVMTVSKISSLWALPSGDELAGSSAMLGWTGGTVSLQNFLTSFVKLGGGPVDAWPIDRLGPLEDYLLTLRAPLRPAGDLGHGREVFVAAGCQDCHGGPRGMGSELYDYATIGTDSAMKWWADGPDHDGAPAGGIQFGPGDSITHAIKSPRLAGLWAQSRFLHDGALDSLDQLLCLTPRPGITMPGFGDAGHTYGCELSADERHALIDYLLAH